MSEEEQAEKAPGQPDASAVASQKKHRFVIVGIGASAGSLEAFKGFLTHLPPDSGMAFVIVQHLDPQHESILPDLLTGFTRVPVQHAQDKMPVEPNHVYVVPPNATLGMEGGVLRVTTPMEKIHHFTPINFFFDSLARDQGRYAVGIVLSGAGSDATLGLKAIKERGGITIAQSPESAKYESMPQSAIVRGLADHVLPVEHMPAKLLEYADYLARVGPEMDDSHLIGDIGPHLEQICSILLQKTGHDFSGYKQTPMRRRIDRRMQVMRVEAVADYVKLLEQDHKEAAALLDELLISVTHFFRDREAFQCLTDMVIPKLFEGKDARTPVRVWVAGCASGEEAYSIAILLREHIFNAKLSTNVQLFATDIDAEQLDAARQGRYPLTITEQVSPERLDRFFTKEGETYRVAKDLRDMCIFSVHSLIRNPPFAGLDLICCRNLLIYLDSDLQKKLTPLFHYALRERGYLFLGSSEGLISHPELFSTVDKKHRIFQRREGVVRLPMEFPLAPPVFPRLHLPAPTTVAREQNLSRTFERVLLEKYAPAGVMINEAGDILCFSGSTSRYLQHPQGSTSINLIDMARLELRLELRAAIRKAAQTCRPVVNEGVLAQIDDRMYQVKLTVRPMSEFGKESGLFMVIFQETAVSEEGSPATTEASPLQTAEPIVQQLENELKITREDLHRAVQEWDTTTEELKSSNEELLSMNEELQSANEELQTSKEEMQSVNEELETVNTELKSKVEQLDTANSDLRNLFSSTQIPTIFLDNMLRIKRFTPAATAIFGLIDSDVGRPIIDLAPRFSMEGELAAEVREVLRTLSTREKPVRLVDGQSWFMMRILPYRTVANVIEGVLITFVDVTTLKQAEEDQTQLAAIVQSSDDAILSESLEGKVLTWNSGAQRLFGYQPEEIIGKPLTLLLPPERAEENAQHLQRLQRGEPGGHVEAAWVTKDGRRIDVLVTISPMTDRKGRIVGASKIVHDITDLKRAEEALLQAKQAAEAANQTKDRFLAVLSHELRTPLTPVLAAVSMLQKSPHKASRETLELIRRNVEMEARLIDDLLDLTRVTHGKVDLNKRTIDLSTIIQLAAEICRPDIEARGLHLGMDLCPASSYMVEGDAARLQQVFWNLIKNATKFTSNGGTVGISCRKEPVVHHGESAISGQSSVANRSQHPTTDQRQLTTDYVVIDVSDSGVGIEPGDMERIFNAFEQGERSLTRQSGGLGLGLAISKSLVELHGGTIEAHSDGKGKGSTFRVRLPLAIEAGGPKPDAPGTPARVASPTNVRSLRVLIVEDNADTAEMLRRILKDEGYHVQTAGDMVTALQSVAQERFDLLLSDLGLPDGSGIDLMRELRERGHNLPGIALSGYGREQDIRRSWEAGFAVHMVKPVDMEKLISAIHEVASGQAGQ